jgi:hypothetical protein
VAGTRRAARDVLSHCQLATLSPAPQNCEAGRLFQLFKRHAQQGSLPDPEISLSNLRYVSTQKLSGREGNPSRLEGIADRRF